MSRPFLIFTNVFSLVLMLSVNVLANVLPINGISAAELSARYPNLFVPAGFTFGIWIFIYLLLTLHVIYSSYVLSDSKRSSNDIGRLVYRLNPLFWLTCLLNTSWILAWHNMYIWLSVGIMIALFFTLLKIFKLITVADKQIRLGYMEHISLETPFIIYFSWVAVAMIANITALLVSQGWQPAHEITWSCAMIILAAMVGISLSVFWHRPAYTAVIIWAIIGIYSKQSGESASIATTAIIAGNICLLAAVFGFWHKRKLLFRSSVQIH